MGLLINPTHFFRKLPEQFRYERVKQNTSSVWSTAQSVSWQTELEGRWDSRPERCVLVLLPLPVRLVGPCEHLWECRVVPFSSDSCYNTLPSMGVPTMWEWSSFKFSMVPLNLLSPFFFICENGGKTVLSFIYGCTRRKWWRLSLKWIILASKSDMHSVPGWRSTSANITGKSKSKPLWATRTALKM